MTKMATAPNCTSIPLKSLFSRTKNAYDIETGYVAFESNMAIDLFSSLFHWTNNMSYSNEYLDTNSPTFTSSSARGTSI